MSTAASGGLAGAAAGAGLGALGGPHTAVAGAAIGGVIGTVTAAAKVLTAPKKGDGPGAMKTRSIPAPGSWWRPGGLIGWLIWADWKLIAAGAGLSALSFAFLSGTWRAIVAWIGVAVWAGGIYGQWFTILLIRRGAMPPDLPYEVER